MLTWKLPFIFFWLKKYVLLQQLKIWGLIYFIWLLQALIPSFILHFYSVYTWHNCITESGQFRLVCLAKPVLITVLSAMNNLCRYPMKKDSTALRLARYKQNTWWIHNHLGKGMCKITPACTVKEIHINYPSEDSKYILFMKNEKMKK